MDIINRFAEPTKPTPSGNKIQSKHKHQKLDSITPNTISALTPRMPNNMKSITPIRGMPQQQKYNPTNTRLTNTGQSQGQLSPLQRPQIVGIVPTPILPSSARSILQNRQPQQQVCIQQRTPFPVINPNDKSILEKMVDFLIGDGTSSRFAMICKECHGHNGMASFEDYQYTAFNCVYCKTFNAARKLRPVGPRLPNDLSGSETESQLHLTTGVTARLSDSSTSSSERESGKFDLLKVMCKKIQNFSNIMW